MKNFVFISGNQRKADYLAKWLGHPVAHHKLDLDEIQSLNLEAIVEHKARQAHQLMKQPVLVEDVALTFTAMGRLPGPLIKWFLEELGNEGLCKLTDGLEHRRAVAEVLYGLHDGQKVHFFHAKNEGEIAKEPRGDGGFGWNPVFIPKGQQKTFAEMTDDQLRTMGFRAEAVAKLSRFLQSHN